ncbi:MAG: family 78 glycoside hydrolase catalytic domain [Flavobacteriales bacterium]|nr:family 78 glycoside hydrolase catalytic domain [Flavobacteriales bacterium]
MLRNIFFITVLAFLFSCNSSPEKNKTPLTKIDDNAYWIEDGQPLPESDSLFYLDHPAPLFRKTFEPNGEVESAQLRITAAGYYLAYINGTQIGEHALDPAWTDFSKRIYYSEFDVTDAVNQGKNCLGVSLGNGFYNPLPLRKWRHRNLRKDLTVGKPVFIANLFITYTDGNTEEVVSDASWKYATGPITKNSVYIGVAYNANNELEGWKLPSYNDDAWKPVTVGKGPNGSLQKAFSPPVTITQTLKPVEISTPNEGIYLVDMGVNFTGTYRIKLNGEVGDTITFRFGERIYEDGNLNPMTSVIGQIKKKGYGGPGAPDIAWQTDSYIIGKNKDAWFTPDFTYHTYRYMEIVGLKYEPVADEIEGLFFNSNVVDKNSFSCSSDLLNSIQEITERTFLANLISVQSDCPAREKFGYGGDLNATSESFIYNYDMQSFYRKTVYDWVDAMNDDGFVDTAPFVGVQYCGISWESAYLTTQYYLYLYYNDVEIVKEMYDFNKKWMEKVERIHPNGLVDAGLSDHESLKPVPVGLTGTSHYYQCANIMATFANVMKDSKSEEKYNDLAARLKQIVKEEYWDQAVSDTINKQTLFSNLLYHGIVPENEIEAAKDSLLKAVKNGPASHFNTGIFGTKYVLEALSENGLTQEVFDIVNSTTYPGWGHMIDNGATTIWETWKESDNTYSNCHPMFGTVTEWYYRWLGGIRPDENNPGFKTFTLAPNHPEGLNFVKCVYESPQGQIKSNWEKGADGNVTYTISTPKGSTAHVTLPLDESQEVKSKTSIKGLETGSFELGEGDYEIVVSRK